MNTCIFRNNIVVGHIIFIFNLQTTRRTTCLITFIILITSFQADCFGCPIGTSIVTSCLLAFTFCNSTRPSVRWCVGYMILLKSHLIFFDSLDSSCWKKLLVCISLYFTLHLQFQAIVNLLQKLHYIHVSRANVIWLCSDVLV